MNPYTRGNQYGRTPDPYEAANSTIALVAMLEGVDAVANLEEVAALDEIDAVFVGPMDLSGSLGLPGDVEHPTVVEAVQNVIMRAQLVDTPVGVYAPTPEAATRWIAAGAAFVALSADLAMAADGFAAVCNAVDTSPQRLTAGESSTGPPLHDRALQARAAPRLGAQKHGPRARFLSRTRSKVSRYME